MLWSVKRLTLSKHLIQLTLTYLVRHCWHYEYMNYNFISFHMGKAGKQSSWSILSKLECSHVTSLSLFINTKLVLYSHYTKLIRFETSKITYNNLNQLTKKPILDYSISSELFFLEVWCEWSLIDPVWSLLIRKRYVRIEWVNFI
jgi:hypothetical protein